MLKLTIFSKDEQCTELGQFKFSHMTMFDQNELTLDFLFEEDQMKCIRVLLKNYVLFSCQGSHLKINTKEFLRVRYRIDSLKDYDKL